MSDSSDPDSVNELHEHAGDRLVAAARALGARGDWPAALELLSAAEARRELDAQGLELLAECARWVGDNERVIEFFERAHHACKDDPRRAARTALRLCHAHMDACESALAASWWRRADELIASLPECAEHGLHAWFAGRARGEEGDLQGHEEHARRALEIARRFGDRNVEALALVDLGHVAAAHGRSAEAVELMEEATALALGGEIGVLESGLVYCNAITACRARGDWDRAQQWTQTADRWVARVQVAYFPGLCRVHRAEVLRIRGELAAAESEAQEAVRLLEAGIPRWTALAHIELGEIRRRRGRLAEALEAYRNALAVGGDPQPGLALLMLAQGDASTAHAALERFCGRRLSTLSCGDRTALLRARVKVAIAAGEQEAAQAAAGELAELARGEALLWERAAAAEAAGELALARGDGPTAVERLQAARALWAELDAPFELAEAGQLLGRALDAEGDALGAQLELEAARGILDRLGVEAAGVHPAPLQRAVASGTATLRREGDLWTIHCGDVSLSLRHSKGLAYLARLLEAPGCELLALDLAGVAGGKAPEGDLGEMLDGEARSAYRRRLAELEAELEEAAGDHDLARKERCRAELDGLTEQLVAAVGLGGRLRRSGDPHERARQSVTKAVRGAIRRIADADESLGRYLSNTVRTGVTCCFDPDPGRPLTWLVEA